MSTGLQTNVDSVSIVDGVWQETATNLGIIEQSRMVPTWHGRGNLYVLVETIGGFPDPSYIEQRIVDVISEYHGTPGSVTAGIRASIKAANTFLFEENLNAQREERGVAGVTCVVLKDQDAYIGQCGPAVLYHVGKAQFQRLPQESTWLSSPTLQDVDISAEPPLGLRRDVEPELFHLTVRGGDVLILTSTSVPKSVSDREATQAGLRRHAREVRSALEDSAKGQDVSLIVVELMGMEEEGLAEGEGPERELAPAGPSTVLERLSSRARGLFGPSAEEPEDFEEAIQEEREIGARGTTIDIRSSAQSAWRLVSRLGREAAALLARVLPETDQVGDARPGRRPRATSREGNRRWLYAALIIPLAVLILVAVSRFQHDRARQAEFAQFMQQAQEAQASAESRPLAEQRTRLGEALGFLEQAAAIKPEDEQVLAKQEEIQLALDRINGVVRIPYLTLLQEFPDTETERSQLRRVVVRGIDVYVVDTGTNRVYKYLLDETGNALQALEGDPIILRKGDRRNDTTIGELLDITWVEAGGLRGISSLMVMDLGGHVVEYDPLVGLKPLPVADTSQWATPEGVVGYYGRLYVLDPEADHLLRYILTNQGYDGEPTNYFDAESGAQLRDAVDVAIDGNVYILHSDGTISKYEQGSSVPFPQNDLDQPLQAASAIYATGFMDEDGYVYVADPGNQRIVQFSKAGDFIQQFVVPEASPMDALTGLSVDETQKKLFLVGDNKLHLWNLP
jgi:hypothetical protein